MNTRYVSIDIETSGLNPENCQVLEIGAVIDDGTTPIEDCPTFHCYVDHGLILGEPFAISMHATILRRIATHEEGYTYLQPWEVATRFRDFLKENGLDPENEKIVVAGKNYARFDSRFLSKIDKWDEYIKVHHRILDPVALYWRPETDGVELPDTKTCMHRVGISGEVAHTAVEDARIVALLIRRANPDANLGRSSLPRSTSSCRTTSVGYGSSLSVVDRLSFPLDTGLTYRCSPAHVP